jgi:hypothetical protein
MLVACRLAGLSALGAHYAGVNRRAQCGADAAPSWHSGQVLGLNSGARWARNTANMVMVRIIVTHRALLRAPPRPHGGIMHLREAGNPPPDRIS